MMSVCGALLQNCPNTESNNHLQKIYELESRTRVHGPNKDEQAADQHVVCCPECKINTANEANIIENLVFDE
jgi:hypothetical protein